MAEIVKKRPLSEGERKAGATHSSSVIERDVFDASRKARQILADAQAEAERVVREAQAAAAHRLQDAQQQGFAAGRMEGLQKYEEAILSVNHQYEALLAQAEDELLKLSTEVARKLI